MIRNFLESSQYWLYCELIAVSPDVCQPSMTLSGNTASSLRDCTDELNCEIMLCQHLLQSLI